MKGNPETKQGRQREVIMVRVALRTGLVAKKWQLTKTARIQLQQSNNRSWCGMARTTQLMLCCYYFQRELLVRDNSTEQFSCTHSAVQRADTTKLCDKAD